MTSPERRPLPPFVWEIVAASLILTWRVFAYPWSFLWQDWVVILSVYWIYTALASKTRAWPYVTAAVMFGLLLLYAHRQLPFTLDVLGFMPS